MNDYIKSNSLIKLRLLMASFVAMRPKQLPNLSLQLYSRYSYFILSYNQTLDYDWVHHIKLSDKV